MDQRAIQLSAKTAYWPSLFTAALAAETAFGESSPLRGPNGMLWMLHPDRQARQCAATTYPWRRQLVSEGGYSSTIGQVRSHAGFRAALNGLTSP